MIDIKEIKPEERGQFNDWRELVTDELILNWDSFNDEQKQIIVNCLESAWYVIEDERLDHLESMSR